MKFVKKKNLLLFVIIVSLSCFKTLFAQNILPNASFESGQWTSAVVAPSAATFQITTTDTLWGQQAIQASVTNYNSAAPTSIRYSSLPATTTANTQYVLSFWAKASVENRKVDLQADFDAGTDITREFNLTTKWRYYEFNFTSTAGSTTTTAKFAIKGTGNFYFDECRLITNSNWFNDANYRIDIARKGNFKIKVRRQNGSPVVDSVYINQKYNNYRFGTAMALNGTILNPANYKWAHDTMATYFNTGVPENDTKWHRSEPNEGVFNYLKADSMVRWSDSVGWHQIRGHAFLWGGCRNFHLAPWQAPDLNLNTNNCSSTTGAAPLSATKWHDITRKRVLRDAARFSGIIDEWDILNEGGHETYVRDRAAASGGPTDSLYWQVFRWAKEAHPGIKTTINDYSTVESDNYGGYNNSYESLINTIDQKMAATNSGKIDIVGFQAHFFGGDLSGGLIQFDAMRRNMERYGRMGKEMKFTEFDVNGSNEAQHATNTENMMRFSYSHPGTTGLYWWGFWDGKHWRASEFAGMWRADKTRKPSGNVMANLLKNEWSSSTEAYLNGLGETSFRGHYGIYSVRIKVGNTYIFREVNLDEAANNQTVEIVIPNSVVPIQKVTLGAIKKADVAKITLNTIGEQQTGHFELEHSSNSLSWTTIGNANTQGNFNNIYNWSHNEPSIGINYYRVKIIDQNGYYTYSEIKTLEFGEEDAQIKIAPNPTSQRSVTVEVPIHWVNQKIQISILSSLGAVLARYEVAAARNNHIKLPSLPSGTYYVIVTNMAKSTAKSKSLLIY